MSSLPRRIVRNRLRRMADYVRPLQQHRLNPDGGYSVLHPTKGWRTVSVKRL